MSKYASRVVAKAQSWLGKKESDGSFREIIDIYNSNAPLARGYRVKYTDEWCATFVSAVAISLGYTDIMPTECGCNKMIDRYKELNCWIEDENRTPNAGDIIFYDWQDNSLDDNKGSSDHVGIVEKVENNTITVIEGNKSESVTRRTIKVNGKYIRGYAVPKYDEESNSNSVSSSQNHPRTRIATSKAKKYLKEISGTYKAKSNVFLRNGASIKYKPMIVIPKDHEVQCYGYYSLDGLTRWYYVAVVINKIKYTGFCHSKYLEKV